MGLFKNEQSPSIKGEMDKLDEKDKQRQATENVRRQKANESNPDYIREKRMENAVKVVKVETYTPEALTQAQHELQEAEAGYQKLLSKPATTMAEIQLNTMDSEQWQTKIGVAKETIKQLEELRDLNSARQEVSQA
jgi:hypothetical protein